MGIDQFPELGVFGQRLVFRTGKLRAKGEVFQGIFVENAVDDEAGLLLLKIDAVVARAVTVEGTVGPANRAEAIGMTGQEVRGQDIELAQNLDLERGGELTDLRGAGRGENDLKSRHAIQLKFKLKFK